MRNKTRKFLSILLCFSMAIGMTGCTKKIKKEPKPKPKVTVAVEKGNSKATGKGDGQADSPIIIGIKTLILLQQKVMGTKKLSDLLRHIL